MLSHINKRVKGHPGIGLPLAELVALHQRPGAAPMTRNFALVYVEMAFGRATPDARLAVVRGSWVVTVTWMCLPNGCTHLQEPTLHRNGLTA